MIQAVLPAKWLDEHTKYHINPTGRFVIGGPMGDTGLTGRKIIVDTYGGMGRHGGGAFSAARIRPRSTAPQPTWRATSPRTLWRLDWPSRAEVQLAYAIGVAEPVSVLVETFGTGKLSESKLTELVRKNFSLNAQGHHREPEPAPADLPEDRGVRALWPHRAGVHLGSDRQGRKAGRAGGCGSGCCEDTLSSLD